MNQPNVTLHLGDCLEVMAGMETGSVDCAILDPPYFEIVGADWDNAWDSLQEYIDWLALCANQWRRVLKDNGSLYVFCDDKVAAYVQVMLDQKFLLLNNLVWYKTNNLPIKNVYSLRSYAPMTERILFYTCEYDPTGWQSVKLDMNNFMPLREYFRQYQEALGLTKRKIIDAIGQPADHCFRWNSTQWDLPTPETYAELGKLPINNGFLRREYEFLRREYEDLRREYEDLRREYEDLRRTFNSDGKTLDVITGPIITQAENTDHPTTKPTWIYRRLIEVSTNPGDTVLDCYLGSGTCGIACAQTGRRLVGIESNPTYFAIAEKRINDARMQLRLGI